MCGKDATDNTNHAHCDDDTFGEFLSGLPTRTTTSLQSSVSQDVALAAAESTQEPSTNHSQTGY